MRKPHLITCCAVLILAGGACTNGGEELNVELSGNNEVCDDPAACGGEGSGDATIEINPADGEVCYSFDLSGMENITAAHIHEAPKGQSGDPVVDLAFDGPESGGDGCVDGVEESLLENILGNPSDFYVNVHTEDFPDGAGRAQLE